MDTVPSTQEHGCYQCGSAQGSFQRLCPECTKRSEEKRAKLRKRLHVDTTGESDPFVFRILTLPTTFALAAAVGAGAAIGGIWALAGRYSLSEVTLLLALTTAVTFVLTVVSLVGVWVILKRNGIPCAKFGVLCPPLLYKPVVIALREGETSKVWQDVRIIFTAHTVGAVLFLSTLAFAFAIDINIFEPRSYTKTLQR